MVLAVASEEGDLARRIRFKPVFLIFKANLRIGFFIFKIYLYFIISFLRSITMSTTISRSKYSHALNSMHEAFCSQKHLFKFVSSSIGLQLRSNNFRKMFQEELDFVCQKLKDNDILVAPELIEFERLQKSPISEQRVVFVFQVKCGFPLTIEMDVGSSILFTYQFANRDNSCFHLFEVSSGVISNCFIYKSCLKDDPDPDRFYSRFGSRFDFLVKEYSHF